MQFNFILNLFYYLSLRIYEVLPLYILIIHFDSMYVNQYLISIIFIILIKLYYLTLILKNLSIYYLILTLFKYLNLFLLCYLTFHLPLF